MSQILIPQHLTAKARRILGSLGLGGAKLGEAPGVMRAGPGEVIFKPGDQAQAYLILLEGCIRVDLTTRSDRELVLYRVRENQTCLLTTTALLQNEVYYARGVVEEEMTALVLPKNVFAPALAGNKKFLNYVLANYAARVEKLVQLVDRLANKDVGHDLMDLLKARADENGDICITQMALARDIGTAREVIARKLAKLEKQGAIRRRRGRITLL